MNSRRSHLEVLVCALLLAALVVQPAAGDGKGKEKDKGQAQGQAHAQVPAHAQAHGQAHGQGHGQGQENRAQNAPAAPTAQAPPPAGAPSSGAGSDTQARPTATAKKAKAKPKAKARAGAKRAAAKARNAQSPNANAVGAGPPGGVTPGPPDHANGGGNGGGNGNGNGNNGVGNGNGGPVDAVPGAAPPEERDPGTSPGAGRPSENAGPPAAEENSGRRGASTGARIGPDPIELGPAPAETPQSGAIALPPATTAASGTQEPAGGSVATPDEATGSRTPRNAPNRTNGSLRAPQASGLASGTAVAPAAPVVGSALEAPLVTPATEAITRVRPAGPAESGGPRPTAGDSIDPLQGVADSGASDSSVGEVLVEWAKYALALLGLLVVALGIYTVLATARARRLERQRARLMEDIGLLQAALLPAVPARLGALLTTVAYRPADGPAAGGDFYDAFALPDGRVGLLLGDVSGHGRQALAKTTLVRFTVRAHLEAGLSPREALAIAGRSLDGRLSDDFATVIAAIHDPVKGTLTYASAGHPPPIVVGPARHRPLTVSSAPPIGVGFPTGQRQTVLPMPEGTSVMIYSDGLLEARVDGVPLGPERLAEWLDELGPEATAKAVLDRVVTQADRVPDDLAAVLLHAAPGATAPAARIEQLKLDVLDMDGPDLEGFLRGAGVSDVDRLIAGRRVSELLAKASGVIVEVRTGEHPMVSVAPIGDESGLAPRPGVRTR